MEYVYCRHDGSSEYYLPEWAERLIQRKQICGITDMWLIPSVTANRWCKEDQCKKQKKKEVCTERI